MATVGRARGGGRPPPGERVRPPPHRGDEVAGEGAGDPAAAGAPPAPRGAVGRRAPPGRPRPGALRPFSLPPPPGPRAGGASGGGAAAAGPPASARTAETGARGYLLTHDPTGSP